MKDTRRRVERNQEKILRAAMDLFQTQGIKKVTVHDVALSAGVTPATVYNRFGSKDELVREAVKYWYRINLEEYQQVLKTGKDFREKLQDMLTFKSAKAGKIHGEFALMASSDDPSIREFLQSSYMVEVNRSVDEFFEEGRRQGYVDPNLSTQAILRFSELIRRGIAAETDLATAPDYTARLMKEITPLILYGILGKPKVR